MEARCRGRVQRECNNGRVGRKIQRAAVAKGKGRTRVRRLRARSLEARLLRRSPLLQARPQARRARKGIHQSTIAVATATDEELVRKWCESVVSQKCGQTRAALASQD